MVISKNDFNPDFLDSSMLSHDYDSSRMRLCYLVNEAISQLRYRAIKRHVPITYSVHMPQIDYFEIHIQGHPMLININNPNVPFHFTIVVDLSSIRRHLDEQMRRLDEQLAKVQTNEEEVPDGSVKNYVVRTFKPPNFMSTDMIGAAKAEDIAKRLYAWVKRQKINHMWELSIQFKCVTNSYTIFIRREGWCSRAKTQSIRITPTTKWMDVDRFQRRLIRLEMAKQQHAINAHEDTDLAVAAIQSYLDNLPPSYKFWVQAHHQWHNQTWTRSDHRFMDTNRLNEAAKTYLI